jgi:hypothetical protein
LPGPADKQAADDQWTWLESTLVRRSKRIATNGTELRCAASHTWWCWWVGV